MDTNVCPKDGAPSLDCLVVPAMKCLSKFPLLLLSAVLLVSPVLVQAGIVVRGSRVVYEEAQGEVVVQLRQAGDEVSLVQLWLDEGNDSLDAHLLPTPFLITPTVTRMDPGSGQSVRVRRVGDALPQDRESLFFFNVLEIPPVPTRQIAAEDNYIQFSSRLRLKFFYRPKGLNQNPAKANQLLRFSLQKNADGEFQVQVRNPSPYHMVFKTLTLRNGAGEDSPALAQLSTRLGVNDTTVAPMAELLLPLDAQTASLPASGLEVRYEVVGDYGNILSGQRGLE